MSEKTKCTKVTIKPGNSVTVSNSKQDSSVTYGQHYVQKMPEYIEREDTLRQMRNSKADKPPYGNWDIAHDCCIDIAKNIPTADVAEIVRCKDCEHLTEKGICEKFRQRYPFYPEDDFHCGFGKRKEGADNA